MKIKLLITYLMLSSSVIAGFSNTNTFIRVSKDQYKPNERIKIEVVLDKKETHETDQQQFFHLSMGEGTIVIMSGTSTVHRAEMFPISAPAKTKEGLYFFHYIGIPGRSPTPNLSPGKYTIFIEKDKWKSNAIPIQITEAKELLTSE